MAVLMVCTQCGNHGKPKSVTPGSIGVELLLWLFFLIPGLIYSFWRMGARYSGCAFCGSRAIIPVHSPRGRMILEEMARARSTQPLALKGR